VTPVVPAHHILYTAPGTGYGAVTKKLSQPAQSLFDFIMEMSDKRHEP
jgi:hypothetical protein